MHDTPAPPSPSTWLVRWAHLIAPGGTVLDLACGSGRHLRWLAARGHRLTGVDIDAGAVGPLHALAEIVVADLEGGPWPLDGRRFDAVVVINYLWRPLWPRLVDSLAPGGVLICETFAEGQESVGRPRRPEFLLRHGELLERCAGLRVVAYEDGFVAAPERFVQRVVAVRALATGEVPPRFALEAAG